MDIVVLAAAVIATARVAATLARRYAAYDVVNQIYELMTQYGDAIHIALGTVSYTHLTLPTIYSV